jgi:glycosyltransferase involved in cell wall biosynthesis
MRPLKILTWHTHGGYLYYLTQAPHEFHVLSKVDRPPGYTGRWGHLPWGPNVHDLPVEAAAGAQFDCILFQDDHQYFEDQHRYLTPAQRRLPKIYLEHDPPRDSPTDSAHPVDDPETLLVHVTHFNRLMWDSGRTPACVIEHGVLEPRGVHWRGEIERGLVVVNNIARRGRRLGCDVFHEARRAVPLDLVGMGAKDAGGLGEVQHADLARFSAGYRFFFNPIRYTSLGLAVIEAMMIGMPVIGLATTEMVRAIENGRSGYVDTDLSVLVERMKELLVAPGEAARLGEGARRRARERFGIDRFVADWNRAFAEVTNTNPRHSRPAASDASAAPA